MIPPETVQQIHDIAQIEDVVGEFVTLKKRGANMLGLCPFHNEKTPSFTVSPTKNIYKCFGCGKAGNPTKFIMEHEQVGYPEALKYLAKRYGIEIEENNDEEYLAKRNHFDSLFIVNQFAKEYFIKSLTQTNEGKSIGLSYFKERGFRENTLEKFGLGFSLDGFQYLIDEAEKKGYKKEYLKELGLASEKNGRWFDFFRNRVMFPIHNPSGKVIAFAGRTLSSDKKIPKYVNSPETEIYVKNKVLYGMHLARKSIRQMDNCFLVEGYTDVISMHQAGIENVVASSGTSLTEGQIQLIKRYTPNITVLYDGDAAGINAALRGTDMILEADMNVKVVLLPEGEDPDSFVKSSGQDGFLRFVAENEKDFIFFKTDLLAQEAANDPIKKTELIKSIVESLSKIPDAIKRSLYIRECARLMEVEERIIINETNKIKRGQIKKSQGNFNKKDVEFLAPNIPAPQQKPPTPSSKDNLEFLEKEIVRVLLKYGSKEIEEEVFVIPFILADLENSGIEFENQIYKNILILYDRGLEEEKLLEMNYFLNHEEEIIASTCANLLIDPYSISHNWEKMHDIFIEEDGHNFKQEIINLLQRFKLRYVMKAKDENAIKIKEAQENGDEAELMKQIQIQMQLLKWQKELSEFLKSDIIR